MKLLPLYIPLFLIFCNATAYAQSADRIHFEKITLKKVRSLLKKAQLNNTGDIENMQTACFRKESGEGYSRHVFRSELPENTGTVWGAYRSLNPKELGQQQIITFGLCYSRQQGKLIYPDDRCGRIETGQIIFSGLRYLGGLVKLAVAQEITEINEAEKSMTFCYMENGKTLGSQEIRFTETETGGTLITHETFYRSKSRFRDKKLYPGLHEKTIVEMHDKALQRLRTGNLTVFK